MTDTYTRGDGTPLDVADVVIRRVDGDTVRQFRHVARALGITQGELLARLLSLRDAMRNTEPPGNLTSAHAFLDDAGLSEVRI